MIKQKQEPAYDTLDLILKTLSDKSKIKVVLGRVPSNLMAQTRVTVGGEIFLQSVDIASFVRYKHQIVLAHVLQHRF